MISKYSFISILLCIPFVISAMEYDKNTYIVGMKIPNATFKDWGKRNPVHMSIAYVEGANQAILDQITIALKEINSLRPITIKVGKLSSMPGDMGKPPMAAMLLEIENSEVEKKIVALYQTFDATQSARLATTKRNPSLHITLKNKRLEEEFIPKEGITLTGGALYIKRAGNYDPIVEFE